MFNKLKFKLKNIDILCTCPLIKILAQIKKRNCRKFQSLQYIDTNKTYDEVYGYV